MTVASPQTPDRFRVLILDGHSAAAVECVQALGRREARIHVASHTDDCIAFRSRYVHARMAQPPIVPLGAARKWLEELYRAEGFDLIIATTDASLALLESVDERTGLWRRAVLPSRNALAAAQDKEATRRLAVRLGIPTPDTRILEAGHPVPPCARYPVVLKSVRSRVETEGRQVRLEAAIVASETERDRVLAAWLPCTAVQEQEFVRGHGYGINVLFEHGRMVWHFAHERLHELPLTGGASTYRRSIAPPRRMLAAAERLLSELGWHGAAMVEFRGTSDRDWCLMEINPRLWGSLALPIDCGVEFPYGLALLAAGQPLPPQPRYRIGYFTRQAHYDLTWFKLNLCAQPDALALTRPRLRSLIEVLRPLWGKESWDHFDWRDPKVMASVLGTALWREGARALKRWRKLRERVGVALRHRPLVARLARLAHPPRVLFVCYGNICRSAAAQAAAAQLGIDCASVGFHPLAGRATPSHVQRAAARLGIDLSTHRSKRIDLAAVEHADVIACMDLENLQALRREFPHAMGRATLLGLFASPATLQIADPYSLPEAEAQPVLEQITAALGGFHGATSAARGGPASFIVRRRAQG